MPSGIQTSSIATAGNVTQLEALYLKKTYEERCYDAYADPVSKTIEPKGSTVQRQWLAKLTPQPTADVGSETSDFTPQAVRDYSSTMTKSYLNGGLKAHELVSLKNSLGIEREYTRLVAELASETIDGLARRALVDASGTVIYGDGTHSTRVTLDLGTAGDRMNVDRFFECRALLGEWGHGDGLWATITDWQYHDLINTSSTAITTKMQYDGGVDSALFKYELGTLAAIRIVAHAYAKRFYAAGAANAAPVATTLNGAITQGATTMVVTANTNISAGMWLTIGTAQTTTESDATLITEAVKVVSVSGTTITFTGSGAGGKLKYDHATLAAVSNADTVHAGIFGKSGTLAVAFDKFGRFGKLVTPFSDGNAKQWDNYSYKYYGESFAAFSRN